jgi:hypothetical protein
MTAPTKRRVGRPRKQPENPDCEPATKGFVKCVARQYHEQQTEKNMEHRRGSELLSVYTWAIATAMLGIAWLVMGDDAFSTITICSALLFVNSIIMWGGWVDTIHYSWKHTDFMQKYEPQCEPKRGCDEQEG